MVLEGIYMKRNLAKYLLLLALPFSLIGCGGNNVSSVNNTSNATSGDAGNSDSKVEPASGDGESTIIKDAKSTDDYVKNKDYKSLAYAYIYNIKDGLQSYESETNGTVKAKILFLDYTVKFNSVTHKKGNAFYSKDHSSSTFSNINSEYYMTDREKIVVSKDLKKYEVFTVEEFKKVSYTMNQYTIMGYVFNDQSILNAELLDSKDDEVVVKYTLDNDLSTELVKVNTKISGGLNAYPKFKNIEFTLAMKKDFTPISYSISATYDASKAVLGSTEVKQVGECIFSNINQNIEIPNEAFLAETLGSKPGEIHTNEEERSVKEELLSALSKLNIVSGVNVSGNLSLNLAEDTPINLSIDTNVSFDMARLTQDKLYSIPNLYAKLEGDENFSLLINLVQMFAGDKLGQYQSVLVDFRTLEIVYDRAGSLYLIPSNPDGIHHAMLKIKVADILDLLLQQVNVYNLVTGSNNDLVTFEKVEIKDKDNYKVDVKLNEDTIKSIKDGINSIFENESYAMIKTLLAYKDFDSIKVSISVVDGAIKSLDASLNYIKEGNDEQPDQLVSLVTLHLDASNKSFDFVPQIENAQSLHESYSSVSELRSRLESFVKYVYINRNYANDLSAALEEVNALDETKRNFIGRELLDKAPNILADVNGVLAYLDVVNQYDLNNLTNEDILAILKAYKDNNVKTKYLEKELSEENYKIVTSLNDYVNYVDLNNAMSKIDSEDETTWNLTKQELDSIKLILDIYQYESGVGSQILINLLTKGIYMSVEDFAAKINTLIENFPNP